MNKKRILLFEFHQESNTFNPITAKLEDFYIGSVPEGREGYERMKTQTGMSRGMIDVLEGAPDVEVVPGVFLHAESGGRVQDAVVDFLRDRLEAILEAEGPVDAICAALHGATCSESQDDVCGCLLRWLREKAGNVPVAAGFDLHANITRQVQDAADVICGYQTYPHTDFRETGRRAASLCLRMLEGKETCLHRGAIPALVPPAGYSSLEGPFGALLERGRELVRQGKLLDFTVFPVQPWLDVPQISSTVITVGRDTDSALRYNTELSEQFQAHREEYSPALMPIEEVLTLAKQNTTGKPVILVDAADSTNGGAAGDSPAVALKLLELAPELKAGMFVVDPEAAEAAFRAGVGNEAEFTVGACLTPGIPRPLKAVGRVLSLHDGHFICEGPAKRGKDNDLGPSAVLRFGKLDILVCQRGASSGDPQLMRHFGIEPTLYDLIVVKANTSFLEPYGKFTDLIYYADTPGAGASNLKQLQWKNLPEGLYPFGTD